MQVPCDQKREQIAAAAARMFASRPFHKVRLQDIASAAGVGKGTLYVYFRSKEDLYFSLLYQGFAAVVDRLRAQRAEGETSAIDSLRRAVDELVAFAIRYPQLWELMRTVGQRKDRCAAKWDQKREELMTLLRDTIRRGNDRGEFADPHPELTAPCIPGLVRSVMLYGPQGLDEPTISGHIFRLLQRGLSR